MSLRDPNRTLFEWYDKYVGDAASRREVYGYWTFVVGYVLGIVGVFIYLVGSAGGVSFQIREVAIVMSALGLALTLLGIVLQLPVRRRGVQGAAIGALVAGAAVAFFITVYPQNWLGPGSYNRVVIAVYVLGVGLVAGVAVLVPVLTGERSFLLDEGLDEDESGPIMVGEAESGGLFAVFRKRPAEWRWRLLEQHAVADGSKDYASRPDVESSIGQVRSKVREAGLLEITHAAFRLYEDDGRWRWLLMEEDGNVAATSAGEFDERDAAEESVSLLKEYGPDAELLEIEDAAFDVTQEGADYHWQLLDGNRTALAENPEAFRERDAVDASIEQFRAAGADADVLSIDHLGFELLEDPDASDDPWRWQLVDHEDATLAASTTGYASRQALRDRVEFLRESVGAAPVTSQDRSVFERYDDRDEDGWRWRLVEDDAVAATGHDEPLPRNEVDSAIDRFSANAETAGLVVGEAVAFEVYSTPEGWSWRVVDENRAALAQSTGTYETEGDAEDAIEHVVGQTAVAELIEYETAAFQLYEAEGGDWRWRLIDEGGSVLADSGEEYESRNAAASSMSVLKENAPNADLLEIDSAAIELFRDDAGDWGWRLVDEAGDTIAETAEAFASKADAKAATADVRDAIEGATTRVIGDGAFQVYEQAGDDAGWWWRYVDAGGAVLADGVDAYTTRDAVTRTVDDVKDAVSGAETVTVDDLAFQLVPDGDEWRWRLLDRGREPLAESTVAYEDRQSAAGVVETVREYAADAEVFELRDPVYRLVEHADAVWHWDLVDEERTVLATGADAYESREDAQAVIQEVKDRVGGADFLEYEVAAFELYEDDAGWRWRFIDEDGGELAVDAGVSESREDALTSLEKVREEVGGASMLEIETSAFELHRDEDGWRWRLVDENGNTVAEGVKAYDTRSEARERMSALKEHAPDAGVVVAG